MRSLEEAFKDLAVQSALGLSDTSEEVFEISGVEVRVQSVADWLMGEDG
jgi:hypothetical protein